MTTAEEKTRHVFNAFSTVLAERHGGVESRVLRMDDFPRWLIDLNDRFKFNGENNLFRACTHVHLGARPRTLLAWAPDVVLCAECATDLQFYPVGDEEKRCDGCQVIFPQGIHITVLQINATSLLVGGLCDSCRTVILGSPDVGGISIE